MSDGGGEIGRESEQQVARRKSGERDFVQAIAKVAVAQVCESEGFQAFQQSALDTLADVAVKYIHNVGMTAHFHASLAGRTESNVFDIIQALEDLGVSQGYLGASEFDHCLANSGTVREIIQYIGEAEKIPFAHSIPQFPVIKDRKLTPSFFQIGENPPNEHIPAWLPAFPDPQTYTMSPTLKERVPDTRTEKIDHARQHGKTERSLLPLQRRFAFSEGPSLHNPVDAAKAKLAAEKNPFLAAPLQHGDKEVSQINLPAKFLNGAAKEAHVVDNQLIDSHVSVLETFAPAIEAMKSSLYKPEEGQKKALLSQKPAVQFKIRTGKKSHVMAQNLSLHNKEVEKISPWFEKDCEKGDKKRRAERILKESMENPEELTQL